MGTTTDPDRTDREQTDSDRIDPELTEAFADSMLERAVGAMSLFGISIGDRLGYYDALAAAERLTSAELASTTDTHERYAREWLEHQTVTGVLTVENPDADAPDRRYALPESYAPVLCDAESLSYLAPLASLLPTVAATFEDLLEAFKTGEGVPFTAYGDACHEEIAAMNRPAFLAQLGPEWLASIPDVDARLRDGGRVADIGCGHGWSGIGVAEHYPEAIVDGYDLDAASVARANENAAARGVDDRVTVHHRDAGDPTIEGDYDLVMALECVHDVADPVSVLETMGRLAGDDGAVLVVDERAGESFTPEGNEIEPLIYGFSVLHCLPVGTADEPATGTGTVMRPDTLSEYASAAGFDSVEVLPIENLFFRFYRLHR
ncbi:SAM-dependent methyltransferase [Halosolutus gelatinilyticus]|uniref:SAM-dependent methyltransferase n=1 Tax=Halosolutus gelatinilyticus TaxID=2931975 RepID=UPI001FF23257|nr:methyltransferase domain-containing protein [Halosolutus gelatinilyticus]